MGTRGGSLSEQLIEDAVDELGLDVDRFRLRASDASAGNRFMTGLEFALLPATVMVARFFRGFVAGVKRRAAERGLPTEALGEALGAKTVDILADRLSGLVTQAEEDVRARRPEEETGLRGTLDELLGGALREMRELLDAGAQADAAADVAAYLTENGFSQERADKLAAQIAERLGRDWQAGQ